MAKSSLGTFETLRESYGWTKLSANASAGDAGYYQNLAF
jgi:hypothetical protein